jgi:glycosyltransferase involved in cell wall biosynthesis
VTSLERVALERVALERVAVVVPARDEEQLLPACLDSVAEAAHALARQRPELSVDVVVVLDRCTDRSAAVVAGYGAVRAVTSAAGCVGAARAAGVAAALRGAGDPARTWVGNTDADTQVPADWLLAQVGLADEGVDLVLGTVVPHDLETLVHMAWTQRHELAEGHRHVHGANLGVRGSAYLAAGGFAPVPLHEDVLLADAVRGTGASWVATDATRVRTASRRRSRVSGGFATYLRELAGEVGAEVAAATGPPTAPAGP